MKKALVMTLVAFSLLLAVVAAGLNVIFTVSYVETTFSAYSVQGEEEAKGLKKELDGFVGKSMTFLNLADVKKVVEKYPSIRLESAKKKFPKTVEVVVKERKELFAYEYEAAEGEEGVKKTKYAVIDTDGICSRISDDNVSRTGGENILLQGFALTVQVGSRAEGEYLDALLLAFTGFNEYLADSCANVKAITLNRDGNEDNPLTNYFKIEMREGVVIEMYNPDSRADEMAKRAMELYFGLNDISKTYGFITVVKSPETDEIYAEPSHRN